MTNHFIAIDVETANQSRSSICQVGLVAYSGDAPQWNWSSLVNPEEEFDGFNTGIHGLCSMHVQSAPTFPSILDVIADRIRGQIVASHTAFDCEAFSHAVKKYGLAAPKCQWIDTCEIARLAWPNMADHKLKTLCNHFGIDLHHHDALSDAAACAELLARATRDTRLSLQELVTRVGTVRASRSPIRSSRQRARYSEKIELRGRLGGPLAGHVMICTGEFSIGEAQLAACAAELGCDVEERFSKKRTTILVVGQRDPAQFNGKQKSRKQLDVEAAVAAGKKIVTYSEQEFLDFLNRCKGR